MAFSTQKRFFYVPFMTEKCRFGCVNPCVKLKSYASTIDKRSWSASDTKNSRFLVDLVGCHTSVVVRREQKRSKSPGKGKGRGSSGGVAQNAEHNKARKSPSRYGDSGGQGQSSGRRARSEPDSRHASGPSLLKGRSGYGGPVPGQRRRGQPGRRFSGPNQGYGNPVQRQRSFRGTNLENQGRGGRGSIAHQAWATANPGERSEEGARQEQGGYEWSSQHGKGSAAPEQSGDQYGFGAPAQMCNYDCPDQERNYSEGHENFYSLGTDQGQGHGGNVDPGYGRNYNYGDQGSEQYQVQNNNEAPNQESPEPVDRVQYTNGYEYSNQQDEGNYPNWHPDVHELGQAQVRYSYENMGRWRETEGGLEQGEGWINNEGTEQQDQWHDDQGGEELGQSSVNYRTGNQRSMYDSSHYHDVN
ncbi:uncharacterized protein LOC108658624 [Drosophila navojoa]|uniref:uncharacterized protein LOC108658624 n=1 Tax=Drosophila navojoa TaxID=7232 RepID=UPI0011BDBEF3|nr:uncharacterized protein LOC108658624 [Drosophila navojoa]